MDESQGTPLVAIPAPPDVFAVFDAEDQQVRTDLIGEIRYSTGPPEYVVRVVGFDPAGAPLVIGVAGLVRATDFAFWELEDRRLVPA